MIKTIPKMMFFGLKKEYPRLLRCNIWKRPRLPVSGAALPAGRRWVVWLCLVQYSPAVEDPLELIS